MRLSPARAARDRPRRDRRWRSRGESSGDRHALPRGAPVRAADATSPSRRTRSPGSTTRSSRRSGSARARERVTWFEPCAERCSSGSCRTPSGSSAGSSTSPTTASTGTSRRAQGDRVAYHWEGEPEGERRDVTYADLQREVDEARERAQGPRRRQGHAGRDLHGDGPRGADRDARVRAARRAAHGRLRRLLRRLALRSPERHGVRGADHAGRGVAARHDRAAEAHRGRGARAGAVRACDASSSAARATRCR